MQPETKERKFPTPVFLARRQAFCLRLHLCGDMDVKMLGPRYGVMLMDLNDAVNLMPLVMRHASEELYGMCWPEA